MEILYRDRVNVHVFKADIQNSLTVNSRLTGKPAFEYILDRETLTSNGLIANHF